MRVLYDLARSHDCDAILQLDDFGYWPHYSDGARFLKHVTHYAARSGVIVFWIDGNHENHTALAALGPAFLQTTTHSLMRLAREGRCPVVVRRIGERWWFARVDVDLFLGLQTTGTPDIVH